MRHHTPSRQCIQLEEFDRVELGRAVADALRMENSAPYSKASSRHNQVPRGYAEIRDRAIKARALAVRKQQPEEPNFGEPFTPQRRQEVLMQFYGSSH